MTPWWKDRSTRAAMAAGLVLRLLPMLVWIDKSCVRDECTYLDIAAALLDGQGIVGTRGWLWAPAYPALMAAHEVVFGYPGAVQITQLAVSVLVIGGLFHLGRGAYGERAGRWAAWLYAVNPTHVFYTTSLWSETIYTGVLLAAVVALGWARGGDAGEEDAGEEKASAGGGARRGWLPGFLVGLAVLFRGVATYLLPVFWLTLLWGRWQSRRAWGAVVACTVAAVLTVAPYSAYATHKYGALVVADRTLGQMMWLGNNDFPPLTFDYGNGALANRTYARVTAQGRRPCDRDTDPVVKDDCETAAGLAWIRAHPREFLARMPLRVAQLVTPHTFLTRNLRWGRWRGLPDEADEVLIVAVAGFSFLTLVGGTIGFFARATGWLRTATGGIVLYHVAAIAVLAGLSRYRVPLEPLWMLHLGAFLAAPRDTLRTLFDGRAWTVFGVFVTVTLVMMMMWLLPAGWPTWRSW